MLQSNQMSFFLEGDPDHNSLGTSCNQMKENIGDMVEIINGDGFNNLTPNNYSNYRSITRRFQG